MWAIITFFSAIYYFAGLVPIGYYAFYGDWLLFGVYLAYWVVNFVVLEYSRNKW